jgi:LmbE family N-acetylglucosaminyl deacetylase
MWIDKIKNPHALLIIAHPDDETIFAGGLILTSLPGTKWDIVCCIEEYGGEMRRDEFFYACKFFESHSNNKINPIYFGVKAVANTRLDALHYNELEKKITSLGINYDIVITHNKLGEYGHKHHIAVHECVLKNPFINIWALVSPATNKDVANVIHQRSKIGSNNKEITFNDEIKELKFRAFKECHKSQYEIYVDPITEKFYSYKDIGKDVLVWEFCNGKEEFTLVR